MKTLAIVALLGLAATTFLALNYGYESSAEIEFRSFVSTYQVGYGTTEEFNYRLGVFNNNLLKIDQLNAAHPEATFGVNKFADRTPEEMSKMMGLNVPIDQKLNGAIEINEADVVRSTHSDVDWKSLWTSVKNQGSCGSCWAFSAAATFESRYALHKGYKIVKSLFSEQQLLECDIYSSACNGGWMENVFYYLITKGFCVNDEYKNGYVAKDAACLDTICQSGPHDQNWSRCPNGNEHVLLEQLLDGPIAIAVDATDWYLYINGTFTACGTGVNHGVVLTGYNSTDETVSIRNSWGASWGEDGYINLKTVGNQCGYASYGSFPNF
jgi:C1A family cysteine protease